MKTTSSLDALVNAVTAFPTWAAMVECMKAGYVPTLNGGKQAEKLTRIVRANGFKAFRCGLVA